MRRIRNSWEILGLLLTVAQLFHGALGAIITTDNEQGKRIPKQVGSSPNGRTSTTRDHQTSETGLGGGFGGGGAGGLGGGVHPYGDGKYFQYAHNPTYDEYEFGYRRGNDHHFTERYERGGPAWAFKTKVKWGDKYGGYGEHYWDYNHGDKSYQGGDEGHGQYGHGQGHYSEPVPTYESQPHAQAGTNIPSASPRVRLGLPVDKRKSTDGPGPGTPSNSNSNVMRMPKPWIHHPQPQLPQPLHHQYSPGPFKDDDDKKRTRRGRGEGPSLVLIPETGQVMDESTGKTYWLKPTQLDSTGGNNVPDQMFSRSSNTR